MAEKTVCIIGAGPAGLTSAMELQAIADVKPLVLEMTGDIGGLAKTVNYKGNLMDIGGHRFYSQSEQVLKAWLEVLPEEGSQAADADPTDNVMLVRQRMSRALALRKLFGYPPSLTPKTLRKLGFIRTARIGASYLKAQALPLKPEVALEEFLVNSYGRELYKLFFKEYTEKVWGMPCRSIPKEWGVQGANGLAVGKAIGQAISRRFHRGVYRQQPLENDLPEAFYYPKYGPGFFWEQLARRITAKGGEILPFHQVVGIELQDNSVRQIRALDQETDSIRCYQVDAVFSSMPLRDLIDAMGNQAPPMVKKAANSLLYRELIVVGVLIPEEKGVHLPDNWLYIQEKDVKLGRVQVFNNWSPYMVTTSGYLWLGLEYFCSEGDELWRLDDEAMSRLAATELAKIGFVANSEDVADSTVVRVSKACPVCFGDNGNLQIIRNFTDRINNLYLIGRNGMHRDNNMDHSMVSAMVAVKIWAAGLARKDRIWAVNAKDDCVSGGH